MDACRPPSGHFYLTGAGTGRANGTLRLRTLKRGTIRASLSASLLGKLNLSFRGDVPAILAERLIPPEATAAVLASRVTLCVSS